MRTYCLPIVRRSVAQLLATWTGVLLYVPAVAAHDGAPAAKPTAEADREDAIFGDSDEGDKPDAAKVPAKDGKGAAVAPPRGEEPADLGDGRMSGAARENTELLHRDRTQIGGFFYARNTISLSEGQRASDLGLGNTTLFETYFDSRINDRLRVYARGRLVYNPLADVPSTTAIPGFSNSQASTDEVHGVLSQMWIKFDLFQRVFVTAGRQFVRWGASRFWNPVDVLNTSKYNPLLFFDDRVGPTMIKFHLPIESKGWNFYALALTENAVKTEQIGLAGRAELVFGPVELGLTGMARKGVDPKAGLDISAGVGDFDLTGELSTWFPDGADPKWYASMGGSWSWAYRDDDSLTLGVEYFHNPQGSDAATVVQSTMDAVTSGKTPPPLVPLYTGKDYVGALAAVVSPGRFNDAAITALALTNLTDKSGTAQLSLSNRFLTDLTVETYVGVSWGTGEFRGYVPRFQDALRATPLFASFADKLQAPLARGGLNLRVDL